MLRNLSIFATAAFLVLTTQSLPAQTVAFVNVNVVPMTSEIILPAHTVIVTDGRISQIGKVDAIVVREDTTTVDGRNRYLLPGLAEMHGHIPAAPSVALDRVLQLYAANGITLVRGMLGQASHLILRQQILDGDVLGPRLITSGPSMNGRSVTTPEQGAQRVRDQHATGYDFIKIHPGLTRDEFDAIAATASELGMPFAGHVPADVGLQRALAAGIGTIDHLDGYMESLVPATDSPAGFFGMLLASVADTSKIPAMAAATHAAGVWNVPTQSLFVHVASEDSPAAMADWPEMRYMPRDTVQRWEDSKTRIISDRSFTAVIGQRAIEIRRDLIRSLHDSGSGLLLGSDAPQIFNVPGFSIHRELQYLVDAGLTPYEALLTGTVNPARYFGRQSQGGTIEIGKEADLVLLDANPLEDISASSQISGVMLRGRWVAKTEINRLLKSWER